MLGYHLCNAEWLMHGRPFCDHDERNMTKAVHQCVYTNVGGKQTPPSSSKGISLIRHVKKISEFYLSIWKQLPVMSVCSFVAALCIFFFPKKFCANYILTYHLINLYQHIMEGVHGSGNRSRGLISFYLLIVRGCSTITTSTMKGTARVITWINDNSLLNGHLEIKV